MKAFSESDDLPWPPTADNMEHTAEHIITPDLVRFLGMIISGKDEPQVSKKMKRIVHRSRSVSYSIRGTMDFTEACSSVYDNTTSDKKQAANIFTPPAWSF